MPTVTILGTGTSQGVPVIGCTCEVCTSTDPKDDRTRTAALISSGSTNVLIDIGPDFRRQMLREKVTDIDAVVLTHEHNDHVSGLDDIRPINFLHRKNIPMYGLSRTLEQLRKRFEYVFDPNYDYPGKPRVILESIDEDSVLSIGDIDLTSVGIMHGTLPILGFRVNDFCYITDAKTIDDREMDKLKGLDTLVINALHHNRHYSHLNLKEALAMVEKIAPRQAYLTHISHSMGKASEVSNMLPDNVELAYDGLKVAVG